MKHALDRLETDCPIFDQMRQALQIAPLTPASQGLNHDGEKVEMNKLQFQVNAFVAQIRARPDFAATPRYQKMIEQIVRYDSKLFAAPLVVSTPQGPRSIQPQRTNNLMELKIASQNPEKVPRALKQFIAKLNSPDPIHNFIKSLKSNRIS